MLLNTWNPLFDINHTLRDVDRIFSAFNRPWSTQRRAHGQFPAINVYDQEDQAILVAELPGIDPDKLELTVLDDTVTLKGERSAPVAEEERYYRRERVNGSFARTITLPDTVDPDSVKAEYKHGVLKIYLDKAEVAKPRRIEISS